ncbi:carbohydrate-binding protein [Candidatus Electronema sp. TJ]|uniref:carbohydrate-binding protein n=1 Tax=Candidatus Electronema sp. TJ TaxID=3401573 RepID=UPI003AA87474
MWRETCCAVLLIMAEADVQAELLVVPVAKKVAIHWAGPWGEDVDYKQGDGVQHQGSSYLCLQAHTSSAGNVPPAAAYWSLMAAKGAAGTPVADMRCPNGESVVGFTSGVPLCTSDLTARRVFVTAAVVTGSIGGLPGGDALCQSEAEVAGLGGKYMAFLSNGVEPGSTVEWISRNVPDVAYRLPDDTVVADSTAEFLSVNHSAAINRTANGAVVGGDTRVWTGYVHDSGKMISQPDPATNCSGWTAAIAWTGGSNGDATRSDYGWFNSYGTYCTESHHLYCVQVPAAAAR